MTEALVLAVLAVHNVGVEQLPPAFYVPACLATSAATVGLASAAGVDVGHPGLSTDGLGVGLVLGGVVAVLVGVAGWLPAMSPLFADRRMAGVGAVGTAYRAAVRIPLGTVLLEEVAFRGVLLALVGGMTSSVLFGLWHVVPVRTTLRTNGVPAGPTVLVVTAAGMAVIGGGLCWLRIATGGLAAPALVHAAATVSATVVAHRGPIGPL